MISKIHFFNSAVVVKTVILKNSKKKTKKTVDVSLKKHAPLKKRYVRASQAPLINKTIKKS